MFQSGYHSAHNTEIALFRVTNDLQMAANEGFSSLLTLLDLSAAFDTVDHTILLEHQHSIGLCASALNWFRSYFSETTEYISMGGKASRTQLANCGVPKGSVLGPILFAIYMLTLGHAISQHGISYHGYADVGHQ